MTTIGQNSPATPVPSTARPSGVGSRPASPRIGTSVPSEVVLARRRSATLGVQAGRVEREADAPAERERERPAERAARERRRGTCFSTTSRPAKKKRNTSPKFERNVMYWSTSPSRAPAGRSGSRARSRPRPSAARRGGGCARGRAERRRGEHEHERAQVGRRHCQEREARLMLDGSLDPVANDRTDALRFARGLRSCAHCSLFVRGRGDAAAEGRAQPADDLARRPQVARAPRRPDDVVASSARWRSSPVTPSRPRRSTVGGSTIIQPLLVTTVIFALPLGYFLTHQHVGKREVIGALVIIFGLGIFAYFGDPAGGNENAPNNEWADSRSKDPRRESVLSLLVFAGRNGGRPLRSGPPRMAPSPASSSACRPR